MRAAYGHLGTANYAFYTDRTSDLRRQFRRWLALLGTWHDINQERGDEKEASLTAALSHDQDKGKRPSTAPSFKDGRKLLHLAHGVRPTPRGHALCAHVSCAHVTDPSTGRRPRPAGHFMGPEGASDVGEVSMGWSPNGWVARKNGDVSTTVLTTRTHYPPRRPWTMLGLTAFQRAPAAPRQSCAWITVPGFD